VNYFDRHVKLDDELALKRGTAAPAGTCSGEPDGGRGGDRQRWML